MKRSLLLFPLMILLHSCGQSEKDRKEMRLEKIEQLQTDDDVILQMDQKEVGLKNVDHEMDEVRDLEAEIEKDELRILEGEMNEVELTETEMISIDHQKKDEGSLNEHKPLEAKPDHKILDDLLKKYVNSNGSVNYKGLISQKDRLDEYISELADLGIQPNYSNNEKLAFWINLYNACTIQLIAEYYPVKSIMDIHNGKPWDKKIVSVNGRSYSLNEIENNVIRPQFKEPRIHFAVNCAAISCPKLMNGAFNPNDLGSQLDKMTRSFLANTDKNQISGTEAVVSKIFDWYKEDFGDLRSFLNKYGPIQIDEKATVSFNEYNWSLNE